MKKVYEKFDALYMDPLTDFGFHKIFGPEAKELLIDFLNQIIREEGVIKDIEYLIPEQLGDLETERKAIFDIFCTTENGDYFIVEMQKAKQAFFRDRSIYYASLPIKKQALQGTWDFCLKPVYFVAVLDFVLFNECEEDKEYVVEYVYLTRERTKAPYLNKLKFAFVELPKFRKTEEELKTHFEEWLYILKNLPKFKNRPALVQGEIFEKLFEIAEIKRLTEKEMETYNKSITEYHDVRLCMDCARDEGREEGIGIGIEKGIEKGIKKGIKEGREFVIQKCLQKNMSIDDIIFITGFSKEQINRYMKNGAQ